MAKILVIGSGGREHALVWKLAQSTKVDTIFCLPGSPGIKLTSSKVSNVSDLDSKNFEAIASWSISKNIGLVVVGPEDPLALGLADVLKKSGILCFGPGKEGAQIEADKNWSKSFMIRNNIPTARFKSFTVAEEAKEFIRNSTFEALVVKASGLAAGKGVIVASTIIEACAAVDEILGDRKFGSAGDVVVIEEKLAGEEISCLAFVDEFTVRPMLPSQDHKRLGNGDIGPNTGGMGAYCPCTLIKSHEMDIVVSEVLQRAVDGLRKENIKYCGILYAGMMLTSNGPKTLEFNCRFGDPETQVILPLLESDLYDVMIACCQNKLSEIELDWKTNLSAVGIVMASRGYPETSTKGCVINGLDEIAKKPNHLLFHSGVGENTNGAFITNGGRVLINVALSSDLKTAANLATDACNNVHFDGAQFRTDIAHKGFKPYSISYKSSGVDIDAADALVQRLKPLSRGTNRPGVIGGLGGFGGMFRLNDVKYKNKKGIEVSYNDPVLVQGTDGVGTKLKIALEMGIYDTIGIDLVAMCANDVLCVGAEPLIFLDYIACGKLDVPAAAQIVKGIAEACRETHCALLGGETAEMPTLYEPGKYDLAGYCVGVVEHDSILPRINEICDGDIIIGLPSSGVHSNGFSLVNKIMELTGEHYTNIAPFSKHKLNYGREFLTPTRLYTSDLLPIIRTGNIKAIAHITGGGLTENIPRVLPKHLAVEINALNFKIPPVFGWLKSKGNITDTEMLRTFNCGIGMILIISATTADCCKDLLNNNKATKIGQVIKRAEINSTQVIVKNFSSAINEIAKIFHDENDKKISTSYKDSGVDIQEGDNLVTKIKPFAKSTIRAGVIGGLGGFGGLFRMNLNTYIDSNGKEQKYIDPVLVLGTDGVGTKLKIAQSINKHNTVGIDLVAMCVNDILCTGADPITFLDYYACGRLDVNVASSVIDGIANGCKQSGSALLGGETAEMPGMYIPGDYDLAGFSLGVVEYKSLLPRINDICVNDIVIGLPSNGLHSNGYSLIHKLLKVTNLTFNDVAPFSANSKTFGDELLTPTKIYVSAIKSLLRTGHIKAIGHITGGGLLENIPRILPDQLGVILDAKTFNIPPIFSWIKSSANITDFELLRTFNCGIGLVLIVSSESKQLALRLLYGENASIIGTVVPITNKEPRVIVNNFSTCIERVQRTLVKPKKRVAVLISGTGSNLQALIDSTKTTSMGIGAEIVFVISNKFNVMGLDRAINAGIPTMVFEHKNYKSREDFDNAISIELEKQNIDIICLAGFMRILSSQFVRKWKGKIINIHPSLLPKYKGINAAKQALDAKDIETGCSVHFVDENVDTGAVIIQEIVPINSNETEATLLEKIHKVEHIAFPKALRLLSTDAVKLSENGNVLWI